MPIYTAEKGDVMEIKHEQNTMKMSNYIRCWNRGEHAFHWHEKIEIARCLNNSFSILIDGVNYILEKGDICVIGGQTVHKFILPEDDTHIAILQFPNEVLLKSDAKIRPVKPLIKMEELKEHPNTLKSLNMLLDILHEDGCVGNDEKDEYVNHMYAGLYCLLMRDFGNVEATTRKDKKEKNEFYSVVNYVGEHFKENINVQSVAAALYMDRGRLSKLFLKYAGVSLNTYINSLRVSHVKKLIDGGMTVTSAALESGFQSLRTYNNVKKKG